MMKTHLHFQKDLAPHFYYVRHGRTEANAQSLLCGGNWDIDLNETGWQQAEVAAQKLLRHAPDIQNIVCSSLVRARQTAGVINRERNLPITYVQEWREWMFGKWERAPWLEVREQYLGDGDPPGGESRLDFHNRIHAALEATLSQPGPTLIVAHGAVWARLANILDISPIEIQNCVPYRIELEVKNEGRRQWAARVLE